LNCFFLQNNSSQEQSGLDHAIPVYTGSRSPKKGRGPKKQAIMKIVEKPKLLVDLLGRGRPMKNRKNDDFIYY
jgi:hypothetical protein